MVTVLLVVLHEKGSHRTRALQEYGRGFAPRLGFVKTKQLTWAYHDTYALGE